MTHVSEINEMGVSAPSGILTKRFDYYFHIDGALANGLVRMRWPVDKSEIWRGPLNMYHGNDVVLESGLLPWEWSRTLEWVASAYDSGFPMHSVTVDLLTGGAVGGDLVNMLNTPSVPSRSDGTALSFGFWDSGGNAFRDFTPLPANDQAYIYLTRSYETWMGDLAVVEPRLKARPFGAFVLPGSHNAGMFDAAKVDAILHSPAYAGLVGLAFGLLAALVMIPGLGPLIAALIISKAPPSEARRIMVNLAFTQKDNVKTQLGLGTRFFDFRPGYLHPSIRTLVPDDALYHQHNFVPGYAYKNFLVDVFQWLDDHPTEVVVVKNSSDGFLDPTAMTPSPQTLQQYLQDAQRSTGTAVKVGTKDDLKTPYEQLVDKAVNRRLLFVDGAECYSSYDYAAYATVEPNTVLRKLAEMNPAGQVGKDYTSLSLHATSTGIPAVLAWGALATTDATSPLMSTKARFDHALYPWLVTELPKKGFDRNQLLVLTTDFNDNALTSHAIQLTRARA